MIALVALHTDISSEVLCFGSWRDSSLRLSTVLPEDPSSIPSTHVCYRGSSALFLFL